MRFIGFFVELDLRPKTEINVVKILELFSTKFVDGRCSSILKKLFKENNGKKQLGD
jgi:hypothetical protein